jgi:hypothetical protein
VQKQIRNSSHSSIHGMLESDCRHSPAVAFVEQSEKPIPCESGRQKNLSRDQLHVTVLMERPCQGPLPRGSCSPFPKTGY